MKSIQILMINIFLLFSINATASDCSWDDKNCIADDIDEVSEGTWIAPIVKPVTDEIRDIGSDNESETDD